MKIKKFIKNYKKLAKELNVFLYHLKFSKKIIQVYIILVNTFICFNINNLKKLNYIKSIFTIVC
jgi:hypothetical protein